MAPNPESPAVFTVFAQISRVHAMQTGSGMATTNEPEPVAPVASTLAIDGPEVVIPTAERLTVASPIGWSAIFGASVLTLGIWLLLHLFGVGVGLTSINPDETNSLRSLGIGVGVWSMIAPIIALFIGGLVAGRVAPTINTLNAAIHGAVTWAVAMTVGLVVATMMLASVARGVASAGATVVGTAANQVVALGKNVGGTSLSSLGLDANDLIAPINRSLEERGMPPVRPESVEAAAREALQTAVRQGKLDRAEVEQIIARRTELSQEDASRLTDEIDHRWTELQHRAAGAADQARHAALAAADTTGKVLIGMSVMMVLGLLAAAGGAVLSVRRERREHVRLPRMANANAARYTTTEAP